MKSNIIDIEEGMDHQIMELICLECHSRIICVWPVVTLIKDLECSKCGKVGLMISTGQVLEE